MPDYKQTPVPPREREKLLAEAFPPPAQRLDAPFQEPPAPKPEPGETGERGTPGPGIRVPPAEQMTDSGVKVASPPAPPRAAAPGPAPATAAAPVQPPPRTFVDVIASPAQPGQDPIGTLLGRLTELLNSPQGPVARPRPLSMGEQISIGILAALDPDAFHHIVMPLLELERNDVRQQNLDARETQERQVRLIESMVQLYGSQQQRQMTQAYQQAQLGFKQKSAERGDRALDIQERRLNFAQSKAMQAPAKAKSDLDELDVALGSSKDAIAIFKSHMGALTGGPGGPIAGRLPNLPFIPGSRVRARLDTLLSDISGAITNLRGGKNLTETEFEIFGGAFPVITDNTIDLEAKLEHAVQFFARKRASFVAKFGGEEAFGNYGAAPTVAAPPPPGFIDDSYDLVLGEP